MLLFGNLFFNLIDMSEKPNRIEIHDAKIITLVINYFLNSDEGVGLTRKSLGGAKYETDNINIYIRTRRGEFSIPHESFNGNGNNGAEPLPEADDSENSL